MKLFSVLKQNVSDAIFPSGAPENLASQHEKLVVDALIDIQQFVDCSQYNNTQVVHHCSTYFESGMSLFEAPVGRAKSLHVVDRVTAAGIEDPTSPLDFAGRVPYRNVPHAQLELAALGPNNRGCQSLATQFGVNCNALGNKHKFPNPTDAGVAADQKLPLGNHWSQSSTDSTYGRAYTGIWSSHRGRIYIWPWIQSSETVIMEWDGIKREWADDDLLSSDPNIESAVTSYVWAEHAKRYDRDFDVFSTMRSDYGEKLSKLIYECRKETRVSDRQESHARQQGVTLSSQSGCSSVLPVLFDPPSGSKVIFPTRVRLYTDEPGATIYYTGNGNTPTKDSAVYATPVPMSEGMVIKAVSITKSGCASPITYTAYRSYNDDVGGDDDLLKFYRLCTTDDKAGPWHVFEGDGMADWNWRLQLPLPAETEITRLEMYQTDSEGVWNTGQAWSTDLIITPTPGEPTFTSYPLVIIDDETGQQVNYSYVSTLGSFSDIVKWRLHGATVYPKLENQHYLLKIFTDIVGSNPIEILIDGEFCGQKCCTGQCLNSTIVDDILTVTLVDGVDTCPDGGGGGTDPRATCFLASNRVISGNTSTVTLLIDGKEVIMTFDLIDGANWSVTDIYSSGEDITIDGWGSSTDNINSYLGVPEGDVTVEFTMGGDNYRGNVTANSSGDGVCATSTTSSTSTTSTPSTTSTTTEATTQPEGTCSFTITVGAGTNVTETGVTATIHYDVPSTGETESFTLSPQVVQPGVYLVVFPCYFNSSVDETGAAIEIQGIYVDVSYTGAVGFYEDSDVDSFELSVPNPGDVVSCATFTETSPGTWELQTSQADGISC
jgi:hypothetical protein